MAQGTITAFSNPHFPQVFTAAIDRLISRVPVLPLCTYESDEHEYRCGERAVVTEIDSEREYCGRHFREVSCG